MAVGNRREPTVAEIDALRRSFEESSAAPPFLWRNFTRTTNEGYSVQAVQIAWYWCRLGYIAGINAAPSDEGAAS